MSTPIPLGAVGWLRWMWRSLTSMRTALILLFLLAIASVPGSVLPQRGINPIQVDQWINDNPGLGPTLDRLGFFDVYAAPWFAAVYLLLFVSLVGCVLPRTTHHARALKAPPPPAPRRLDRLPDHATLDTDEAPEQVLDRAETVLRRWRLRRGDDWVAAERGLWRETGNLVFHLALVLVLVGVAVGGLLGWRGNVIVREGEGFSNTLTQFDAWGGSRLAGPEVLAPFSFTLERFAVDFDRSDAQRGSPTLFEADVTYRETPQDAGTAERIEVNYPLSADGAKVFLVGHGYAPRFVVRDAAGEVVFDDTVVFLPQDGNFTSTGVIKLPDEDLGFTGLFLPTAALTKELGPHSVFPGPDYPAVFLAAFRGDLGLDEGTPQSVYTLDTSRMEQFGLESLLPGDTWPLPDGAGSIEFTGFERWASFQIAHDPGKELALIAALLAIAGVLLSLFVRQRRVWVRALPREGGGSVVQVGGLSKTDWADLQAEVLDIAGRLGGTIRTGAADPGDTGDADRREGTP